MLVPITFCGTLGGGGAMTARSRVRQNTIAAGTRTNKPRISITRNTKDLTPAAYRTLKDSMPIGISQFKNDQPRKVCS